MNLLISVSILFKIAYGTGLPHRKNGNTCKVSKFIETISLLKQLNSLEENRAKFTKNCIYFAFSTSIICTFNVIHV